MSTSQKIPPVTTYGVQVTQSKAGSTHGLLVIVIIIIGIDIP